MALKLDLNMILKIKFWRNLVISGSGLIIMQHLIEVEYGLPGILLLLLFKLCKSLLKLFTVMWGILSLYWSIVFLANPFMLKNIRDKGTECLHSSLLWLWSIYLNVWVTWNPLQSLTFILDVKGLALLTWCLLMIFWCLL